MVQALGPTWFLETDVVFDFIFLLATAAVTLLGFSAYRFFHDEKHKLHSTGFLFLAASYLILFLTNLYVLAEYKELPITLREALHIVDVATLGSLLHATLFLAGLTFLIIMYYKVEDRALRWLLFILVFFGVLLCNTLRSAFYLFVAILLLFIIIRLASNYKLKHRRSALLVLLGFIGVFAGEVLLALLTFTPLLYVAAGVVTLIGYLLIIAGLILK